jgi:hypothetical protein
MDCSRERDVLSIIPCDLILDGKLAANQLTLSARICISNRGAEKIKIKIKIKIKKRSCGS